MKITVMIFYMLVILICTIVGVNGIINIVENLKNGLTGMGRGETVTIIGMLALGGWFGWLLYQIVQI